MAKKDKEKQEKEQTEKKQKLKTPLKYVLFATAGLIILSLFSFAVYSVAFQNKNYLNQYVGAINLGGKSKVETKKILGEAILQYQNSQIVESAQLCLDRNGRHSVREPLPKDSIVPEYEVQGPKVVRLSDREAIEIATTGQVTLDCDL